MAAEPMSLAQALVEAQAKFPSVSKDSVNPHFRSKFVSLDALIAATRPVLNAAGITIMQFPTLDAARQPVLYTTITHAPSGDSKSFETPLFMDREDMQAMGAACTYARRYAWAAALGIASEEDTDGEVAPAKTAAKPAERSPKKASPAQIKKLFASLKDLNDAQMMIPPEYAGADDWLEVLKMRLKADYGIESTKELTGPQISELIDWATDQAIPFG